MGNFYRKYSFLSILLIYCNYSTVAEIAVKDNGYSGIVVAFSSSIPESEGRPLIGKIKEIFTNASRVLYNATYEKFYFKEVTVLVPQSWNNENEEFSEASSQSFNSANIRIDKANPHYANRPYTLQINGCGRSGEFIHLTPGYLKNLTGDSLTLFGDSGKNFVHEWAHYRYGIFDEYGIPGDRNFPMLYYDHLEDLTANFCSDTPLIGPFTDKEKGGTCNYDGGFPDKNCEFIPNTDNAATTSMASYYYLPKVDYFCNASNHNPNTPNKHNRLCNGKSTWDVIRENEDFTLLDNSLTTLDIIPSFKIVKQRSPTFVLVVDISGSMNRGKPISRITTLTNAIKRFISTELKFGCALGLITFNETATLQVPITKINSQADKTTFLNRMSMNAFGLTCIGCGLTMAVTELNSFLKGPGGTVILVSDGNDNEKPYIEDVLEQLKKSRIKVNAIAFTNEANTKTELAARETGGKVFFVENESKIKAMSSALYEAFATEEEDNNQRVKVKETSFSNENEPQLSGNFIIDKSIGVNTSVLFAYTIDGGVTAINISSSDGSTYLAISMYNETENNSSLNQTGNTNTTEYSTSNGTQTSTTRSTLPIKHENDPPHSTVIVTNNPSLKFAQFVYDYLKPGRYDYVITTNKSNNQVVVVNVVSSPSAEEPIRARSWISEFKQNDNSSRFVVFAEVKQGVNPVKDAEVTATINRSKATSIVLKLRDNGNGDPDIQKDDGVYSKYFTQFSELGWYSIETVVKSNGKTSVSRSGFAASGSLLINNKHIKNTITTNDTSTGDFERSSNGGTFLISNDNQLNNNYPPGKVYDLRLVRINFNESSAIIQWTAPGDDLDEGTVKKYDIRFSHNFEELQTNFNGTRLDVSQFPQPAGSLETLNISLLEINSTEIFFLALKAVDKSDQQSPMSNIISIVQRRKSEAEPKLQRSNILEVVGIVVGCLVLVGECIALFYLLYKRKGNS